MNCLTKDGMETIDPNPNHLGIAVDCVCLNGYVNISGHEKMFQEAHVAYVKRN